ncbi:metallophosphoesterase [Halorubellus sp. PRR65]|uniref:metallophosphoesterase n=1 Tax=Halorubellus sp. PRR65 TaxID=3098148 RepID=UPI002B2630D5|nr:metallophosphoesterase [Halorubellus sp. PRR65]
MSSDANAPRDTVLALVDDETSPPTVLSLSDVHGYYESFASALSLPADHPEFAPLVERDADGDLHWAGGRNGREYVLVANGDLVDRGGDSERVVETVRRLRGEAPDGHVRYHCGNHEQFVLAGGVGSPGWYCDRVDDATRRSFFDAVADGDLAVAYDGYAYTYSHAGAVEGVDPASANDVFQAVAASVADVVGTDADAYRTFERAFDDEWVTRAGGAHPKGRDAGPLWLGWEHLPADAPNQVVGHTPHERVTRKGNVVCEDVTRKNVGGAGGEAMTVETPDGLRVLERAGDGSARLRDV